MSKAPYVVVHFHDHKWLLYALRDTDDVPDRDIDDVLFHGMRMTRSKSGLLNYLANLDGLIVTTDRICAVFERERVPLKTIRDCPMVERVVETYNPHLRKRGFYTDG